MIDLKIYGAFVFDFDGVIKDSIRSKGIAYTDLFKSRNLDCRTRNKILSHHLANGGVSRSVKLPLYAAWANDSRTLDELQDAFSRIVIKAVLESSEIAGSTAIVRKLSNLGVSLFIVSATPRSELELILSKMGVLNCFSAIFGSESSKVDSLCCILDSLEFKKEELLYFGDSISDLEACEYLGVPFCLIDNPAFNDEIPRLHIPDFMPLIKIVERMQ